MKMLSQSQVKRQLLKSRSRRPLAAGFTLIGLMIGISIILILIGMAAGRYDRAVKRAKEAVLKHDLWTMRDLIDKYTLDKQAAPQSIEDLQQAGYLRAVPDDPMTRAKDWVPQYDNAVLSPDQSSSGMVNVYSKSVDTALDGTKYSDW